MKKVTWIVVLCFMILSLLTASCSPGDISTTSSEGIVGKWQGTNSSYFSSLEFLSNKQLVIEYKGYTFSCTYKLIGDEYFEIYYDGEAPFLLALIGRALKYSIDNDNLTLESDTYERVR